MLPLTPTRVTKAEIILAFPSVSPTTIVEREGEYVIEGKFCVVSYLGNNECDLWLCNPQDLAAGLNPQKINPIVSMPVKNGVWKVLDGEAMVQGQIRDFIQNNLRLLGIRKKRTFTPEQLQAKRENLAKNRRRAACG